MSILIYIGGADCILCGLHLIFKICCLKIVKKFLFDKEENMRFIIFKRF